jgi:hypothetical protein
MYVVSLAIADTMGGLYLIVDAVWILPVTGEVFDYIYDYICNIGPIH